MEDFISYSKIAELLTKALRDELTDEEREVLERWRHEASVHEAFYRRVNTPEFLVSIRSIGSRGRLQRRGGGYMSAIAAAGGGLWR